MRPEIENNLRKLATTGWKKVDVEFGRDVIDILVPPRCAVLSMADTTPVSDPREAIVKALEQPIESPTIEEIVKRKGKPAGDLTAAITVSDLTRPVPYLGEEGILLPVLRRLEAAGVRREKIAIIIGTGTHRPMTEQEETELFGDEVVKNYRIVNHDCEDLSIQTYIGKTKSGAEVYVNSAFYKADIHIATGLVEAHFMAGVSGGRKAVCPGLVNKKTIEKFHSPGFLESPLADNLILEGNPCHQESLEVARTVGVDFIINTTLDKEMKITGVFAGHLEAAHLAAYRFMKDYTVVPVDREYDILLTHGGYVGRNHYQLGKACCNAMPAVKQGGTVVVAADNRDAEPIGGPEYKTLMHLLKLQGHHGYLKTIEGPDWQFTKDQWQAEMWGKVFRKIGEEGLYYCTPQITEEDHCLLPGQCGLDFLSEWKDRPVLEAAKEMVQNALCYVVAREREKGIEPAVAFVREGPYAVLVPQWK